MYDEDIQEFVRKIVNRHTRGIVFGTVTKVYEHTDPSDDSNHEVNVIMQGADKEFRRAPVKTQTSHSTWVPQVDDFVALSFMDGPEPDPVVIDGAHSDVDRAPLARAGHWRHEWAKEDSEEAIYLEAQPSSGDAGTPDTIRMGVKPDGLSEPTTAIEIDNSGSSPEINIESEDGTITLDASSIKIDYGDGSIDLQSYISGHTHDFYDVDSNGDTVSGTTDGANGY